MKKNPNTQKKIGRIVVPPGAFIDIHEKRTVDFLAIHFGYDITFLVANRRKNIKTPDILMNRIKWEIKNPKGKSPRTIENNLRAALLQSPNIILDLRRMDKRIPTEKHSREAEKQFYLAKSMRRLIIIPGEDKLYTLTK